MYVCFYSRLQVQKHPKEKGIMSLLLCLEWGSTLSSCYCYLLSERFPDACLSSFAEKEEEIIKKNEEENNTLSRPALASSCQEARLILGESVRERVSTKNSVDQTTDLSSATTSQMITVFDSKLLKLKTWSFAFTRLWAEPWSSGIFWHLDRTNPVMYGVY